MSIPPPPPTERVTIDGKTYPLRACTRCTGVFQVYLINKESDRNKTPIWEVHNKDGSAHQHDKKFGGGGFRPPMLKFTIGATKTINGMPVTLTAEFLKSDTTFDKAYAEVRAKLEDWAKAA